MPSVTRPIAKPRPSGLATLSVSMTALRMDFRPKAGVLALDDVTLDVRPEEFLTIVGPSGCGKSSLLLLTAGLLVPSSGELLVGGRPLAGPRADVAIVFQDDSLLEWRTVLGNVLLHGEIRRLDPVVCQRRARELLAAVGLAGFEHSYPHQLSGGMRQRAALCRALLCDLPFLLMDEPFGALDALSREEHQLLLQDVWLGQRKTVMFVTHDIREAVFLSDRVAVMSPRPGRILDIVSVDLPRPRSAELTESVDFNRHVGRIRRILQRARGGDELEP